MRVVVSDKVKTQYTSYTVFDSLEKVLSSGSKIDCVVLHSTPEKDFNVGINLSKLKKQGVKVFAYINENPSVTLQMCIKGCGGIVDEDEFYLEDEAELDYLLSTLGLDAPEQTSDLALSSVSVISDFIQSFINGDDKLNAGFYLDSVKSAVADLAETTKNKDVIIREMSSSAVDIFNQASQVLDGMQKSRKELEAKFNEIESKVRHMDTPKVSRATVTMFPAFSYTGLSPILHIHELAPCRYLTTFVLSYHYYLTVSLNKKAKVIFIHQKAKKVSKKYGDYTTITSENLGRENLLDADIVCTDSPKFDVMSKLTKMSDDVFIVVDRLYGDPIIKGTRVKTVNAVSGLSDVSRFGVKADNTIFSVTSYEGGLMCLPNFKNFPIDAGNRQASCFQFYKKNEHFEKLDKILGIKKG